MPRTIVELEQRLQTEVERARRSGFDEGLRKGGEDTATELRACAERLTNALKEFDALKGKFRQAAENEVVRLSLAIARRILHRELMADPDSVQGIVHAALQKLQLRDVLRIRANPSLAQSIRAALERMGAGPNVEITADPNLRIGDLLFDSARGELDASVDTQLEEIQRGFADRLARR
jgi:flagellar assembly protein FliH